MNEWMSTLGRSCTGERFGHSSGRVESVYRLRFHVVTFFFLSSRLALLCTDLYVLFLSLVVLGSSSHYVSAKPLSWAEISLRTVRGRPGRQCLWLVLYWERLIIHWNRSTLCCIPCRNPETITTHLTGAVLGKIPQQCISGA